MPFNVKILSVINLDIHIKFLLFYFIFISIVSVIACVYDKIQAKRGGWRVKESTLLLLSVLGGSAAMLIAMKTVRHKTLHKKFTVGIPLIIILQIIFIVFLYFFY